MKHIHSMYCSVSANMYQFYSQYYCYLLEPNIFITALDTLGCALPLSWCV